MVNVAKKHMKGRTQMTAEQRQKNREEAKTRVEAKTGTPAGQKAMRPKWQSAVSDQDSTGQRISKEFARAMLETFQSRAKFMNPLHIEERNELLDEAVRTGIMSPELQAIYLWTQKERPDLNPHHYDEE